jgi:hypothetical protein
MGFATTSWLPVECLSVDARLHSWHHRHLGSAAGWFCVDLATFPDRASSQLRAASSR